MAKSKHEKKKPVPAKKLPAKQSGLNDWAVYGILLLFSFVLYGNTLGHEYAVDDAIVITDNEYTLMGTAGIKNILTHDTFLGFFKQEKNLVAGGRYRPLSLVTFAIEYQLFGPHLNDNASFTDAHGIHYGKITGLGDNVIIQYQDQTGIPQTHSESLGSYLQSSWLPTWSHLFNILFYALTGIAIYLLLKRLLLHKDSPYAYLTYLPLIVSALFLAHPIHTEAVANIKGRDEILSMLFSITAANLFIKGLDERQNISFMVLNLGLGVVSFFLGLLSKENAITFFAVIPLMVWFFRKVSFKDYLPVMGAAAVSTATFLILRQSYTNTALGKEVTELMNNPFYGMTVSEKYATMIFTFGKYLSLLALPITLSHDYYPYQIEVHELFSKGALLSIIVCAGGLAIAIIQLRKKTLLSFSILYFILTFSVVSNVVFPVGTFMSERFVFMPSLAFCLMLGYVITLIPFYRFNVFPPVKTDASPKTVTDNFFSNAGFLTVLIVLTAAYSVRTIARNPAWKNNYTLFSTDINNSPNSAKLNNAMGGELITQSDKDVAGSEEQLDKINRAKPYLLKALKLYPRYTNAWLLLGNAYLKADKNYVASFNAYKHALEISPDYSDALHNLSVLLTSWKDKPAKIAAMEQFIKEQPRNANLYYQLAQVFSAEGPADSAIAYYYKAIYVDPNYSDALAELGRVYGFSKNKLDSSVHYLNLAIQKNPYNEDAYENLGVAYGMSGNLAEAEKTFTDGLRLNPNSAKLYLNLGVTYSQMGQPQKAQEYLSKAYELDPSLKPK